MARGNGKAIVPFAGGNMARGNGKAIDGGVMDEQLEAVEYELQRSRNIEENDKRFQFSTSNELFPHLLIASIVHLACNKSISIFVVSQNSRVEAEEHNEGEEEDAVEPFFRRRVIAKLPPRSSSAHEDESLIGMDVLLYAWTGPETPIAKATISQLFQTLLWAESPLDQRLMRFLSMLQSEGMLMCLINMKAYNLSLMLSQGPLHGHLAR